MSVVVAVFMALLFLPMQACNARHTFAFVFDNKDVENAKLDDKGIKAFPTSQNTKGTILGDKSIMSMDLDGTQAVELEGLKEMNGRSMLESGSEEETAAANANESEAVEDAVVMDYVQAHRKSPIHNHH